MITPPNVDQMVAFIPLPLILLGVACVIGSIRTEPWGTSVFTTGIIIGVVLIAAGYLIGMVI